MTKALLVVPHFWDPVCLPLGICSLKAYAEQFGHKVELLDLNTVGSIFRFQYLYFQEVMRQFPRWKRWNIERNATEMLAMHQVLYLTARRSRRYGIMVAEIMNVLDEPLSRVIDRLNVHRFDDLFDQLYANVKSVVQGKLAETQPDVVGTSLFNSTWAGSLFVANLAKALQPRVRTVVGGPGPIMGITADAREVQRFFGAHETIDFFVVGEGERAFLEILENPGRPPGIIVARDLAEAALDLTAMPPPDYGELNPDLYLQLSVASSRGCPFECSFCAETVFWEGFRKTSKNRLFETVQGLAERHNRHSFYICDSLSNAVIGPLTDRVARADRPYRFDCYLRADKSCVDAAKIRAWRAGGLYRARLGLESGSQRVLDDMVKMTTPDLMSRSLHALAGSGVMTSTLWVICYPGETPSEFQQTLDFIREHRNVIYQADAWLFQYHPSGLAHSNELDRSFGSRLRFSDEVNEVFRVAPQMIDRSLSAEERFHRLEQFVDVLEADHIPCPYGVYEWQEAERRWQDMGRDAGWTLERSMMALNG